MSPPEITPREDQVEAQPPKTSPALATNAKCDIPGLDDNGCAINQLHDIFTRRRIVQVRIKTVVGLESEEHFHDDFKNCKIMLKCKGYLTFLPRIYEIE